MPSAFHATEIDIATTGLVLPNGLRISSVEIGLPSLVVQNSPFVVPEGTELNLSAVVEAADLQAYLNARRPSGLNDFVVKAEDGLLTVHATMRVMVPVQVAGQGKLEFSEGKLNFVPLRAEVAGVKMPEGMMREQLSKLNPIIDSTGYPLDINVKAIDIENGIVRLNARVLTTAAIPRTEP